MQTIKRSDTMQALTDTMREELDREIQRRERAARYTAQFDRGFITVSELALLLELVLTDGR